MWLTTFLSFIVVYLLVHLFQKYYLHEKITILHGDTARNKEWIGNIPILKKGYTPTIWAFHSVLHGLISNSFRSTKDFKFKREELTNSYGQHLTFDILEEGCDENSPSIFIVPGIGGHSQKQYIKSLIQHIKNKRVIIFNHPGSGDTKLKVKHIHMSGDVEDIDLILKYLKKKYVKSTFIGLG